jgi:oxygen-dependent protoporphyrinogen oxidase
LLSGVYGGSVERLSVRSVLSRFVELEGRYGSLTRGVLAARRRALLHRKADGNSSGALFQTLKGGLAQLTRELERRIEGKIEVRHIAAEGVERAERGFRVRAGGEAIEAAAVILATPAWQAGRLVRSVDENLARSLEGIEYSSSMTVAIGFRQSDCGPLPAGFGFLVPARERQTLVACTFVGAKFPYRVPEGIVVMRCFAGGAGQEAALELDDGEILRRVLGELEELLGWTAVPLFTRIARWRRSMAQYTVGHELRLGFIYNRMKELPGLYLAGNAYDGIGIPDCIRSGRQAAVQALTQPDASAA